MKYYVGIDAGGTKTAFICLNENDNVVKECSKPSCHVLQVDDNMAISILKSGIDEVLEMVLEDDEVYICAGLAGYGKNIQLRKRIENIAANAFAPYNYIIKNDAEIALAGALNGEDGILVIAGTGSIALATKDNQSYRSGGWGYMLGDEGSAYWMAKQLLAAFTMQCDGRMPKTLLYNYIFDKCEFSDDYDIIPYVADKLQNKRDSIAKLAIYAYELAMKNDPVALKIYDEAARLLAQMINALAIYYPEKVKASYAGGVWAAKDLLMPMVKKYLNENIEFVEPYMNPVMGASLLAKMNFKK